MKKWRWWIQPLEGDAQNIITYELVPDLWRDSFVIHDHVPHPVGQWRGWEWGKSREVLDICNVTLSIVLKFHLKNSYLPCWPCNGRGPRLCPWKGHGQCRSCPLPMVVNKSVHIFQIQVPSSENPLWCSVSSWEWSGLIVCIFPLIQFLSTPIWTNQTNKRRLLSIWIVPSTFVLPGFLSCTSQVPVLMRP